MGDYEDMKMLMEGKHSNLSVNFDMDAWNRMDEVDPSVHSSDSDDEYDENGIKVIPPTKYAAKKGNVARAEKQFLQTLRKPRHVEVAATLSPARVEDHSS